MRHIVKQKTPKVLLTYQSTPNATYEGFQGKDDLRLALIKEQKGLCAYCMGRISNDWNSILKKYKTEIEHYKSQELHPSLHLDYTNMLGVCNGNAGNRPALLHCDKARPAQSTLTITPLSKNCENSIKYDSDGTIYSENEDFQRDIDKILNLNVAHLKLNRQRVQEDVVARMKRFFPKKANEGWTKNEINKEIKLWETMDENKNLNPNCQVAIFYLKNKLKRL
jgi:uncharacterized protein (TIGR02646 family)